MKNIENTYVNYDEVVKQFGKGVIESRFQQIYEEMLAFVRHQKLEKVVRIDEIVLMQALLDYFTDVCRLKQFHEIEHINNIKIKAYETFWLIQRKPMQIIDKLEDDRMIYINEKFVLSRLVCYLFGDDISRPIVEEKQKSFQNFLDTLYYYLKFRRSDPQSIELMILAFKAGQLFAE